MLRLGAIVINFYYYLCSFFVIIIKVLEIFNSIRFRISHMNNKQKLLLLTVTLTIVITITVVALTITNPAPTGKIKIVATFYPLAYLSEQIGGEHITVTQLVPDNTEIHTWDPSASHIVATEEADIIIYNGASADHWMESDILPALSTAKSRIVVEATDGLQLVANQQSMEHEEGEAQVPYDPHTWVSPYMAKLQAEKIYNAIVQADPAHQDYYTQRWQTLSEQLTALDNEYTESLSQKTKTVVFVAHEAFGYLASRYDFEQHGVLGLSADEQPSAATIANLVDEMVAYQTYVVYVDPVYSREYVQALKTEVEAKTGQPVSVLDLYLMLGQRDGLNYLEQMHSNLSNLKVGLGVTT